MCGIAGVCNLRNKAITFNDSSLVRTLTDMQQKIMHRGPDGSGVWSSTEHEVGLAHTRLSIIDVSEKAAQPMQDRHKQIVVSFNGEIYNYRELRAQLRGQGYEFFSQSDTEVLLYAYKEWGFNGMLERLHGMFAIALFDRVHNKLFCARDRIGIKPLYFSLQSGIFSFASEIKALWCLPWVEKKRNERAAYHYLTYLATPAPMTLYKDVYKLPPGYSIEINARREISFYKWYDMLDTIQKHEYDYSSQEVVQQELSMRLRSAVQQRMIADVPIGVFLSGGVDSSLITALMAQQADKINTFTVAFSDGPEFDELRYARKVAHYLQTNHHEITINEQDAFDCYQKLLYHQDEPLGDAVCVPLYYVTQLLKKSGVAVVQVGEGADELFCGYNQYIKYLKMMRVWHASQKVVPSFAKRSVYALLSYLYPRSINNLDIAHNWMDNKPLFYSGAVVFSELWKQKLCCELSHEAAETEHDWIMSAIMPGMHMYDKSYAIADYYRDALYTKLPAADPMQMITYLELKHRLPELLLMRVDKMTMAHSVEARVPFLDHTLVEYALGMPFKYKYSGGQTKYILKKACEDLLPHDTIYRTKMGFASPTSRWYKAGKYFMPFLQELLQSKKEDWGDMINFDHIACMVQQNKDQSVDYSYQLWAVQNLLACDV